MRRAECVPRILTVLMLVGVLTALVPIQACKAGPEPAPKAGENADMPDTSRAPMAFESLSLADVQGLHGGQSITIDKAGACVVSVVEPGMHEQRYELQLTADEVAELAARLGAADFPTIVTDDRPGVPDEARPTITVRTADGSHTVGKWDNDAHPRFDHVYRWLLDLVKRTKGLKPVHKGRYGG